ncbi:MAG: hypothetical protein HN509_12590 [Halobacteriovoraceae bacterium]|jgi:hypothetical protein|nr:hypothetical protein [Halobacteriovoraceae bacterium]MBT5095272.1 hypothetical protein [Halobacteriovoraceae bacterium]
MKRLLLTTLTLALFNTLMASETRLATVRNNDPSDTYTYVLMLETDQNQNIIRLHKDAMIAGENTIVERKTFEISKVAQGFVIDHRKGRDIIKLSSQNFAPHNGGHLKVSYLYSGISGKYRSKTIELVYNQDTWELVSEEQERINSMYFEVRKKPIIGIIGIKNVYFNR